MRLTRVLLLTLLVLGLLGVEGLANTTTVAVMTFEEGQIRNWYIDRRQMVDGITETFTDRLGELEGTAVVERSRLQQVISEQDLVRSGRVDSYTAAEAGRLLGARLLVLGTVTELDVQDAGQISLGALTVKGSTARVGLTARVVDVESGEILGSLSAQGQHTGASFSLRNFRGINFSSNTFRESVLGQAVTKAVDSLLEEFQENQAKWTLPGELADGPVGQLLAVVGNRYIINLGRNHGVEQYDRFQVYQLVEVEGLVQPVEVPLGTLRIISVDPEAAVGEIESGGPFSQGNRVRLQR